MIDIEKLMAWWTLADRLEKDKVLELELRKELFGAAFPDPTEGSKHNKVNLADGYILQGDYKINRRLDKKVAAELMAGDNTKSVVEPVLNYTLSLKLPEWRALDDDDRALVSEMVTETPGAPVLKIFKPKKG